MSQVIPAQRWGVPAGARPGVTVHVKNGWLPDPRLWVVNSIGALQYFVSMRYAKSIEIPQGLLESAYMAIALLEHSSIKKPIDRVLIRITNSAEWRNIEDKFFSH